MLIILAALKVINIWLILNFEYDTPMLSRRRVSRSGVLRHISTGCGVLIKYPFDFGSCSSEKGTILPSLLFSPRICLSLCLCLCLPLF